MAAMAAAAEVAMIIAAVPAAWISRAMTTTVRPPMRALSWPATGALTIAARAAAKMASPTNRTARPRTRCR